MGSSAGPSASGRVSEWTSSSSPSMRTVKVPGVSVIELA